LSKSEPEVVARWVDGYAFIGSDQSGHTLVLDAPEKGVARGMSPMQALLTTLGACSGMDVVALLRKRKQKLTSLTVSVGGLRPEFGYPKPYTSINLKYVITGKDLQKEHVDEAVKSSMDKYCSVAATINGRAKIEFSYEIVEG
jgi:putative redox protein